MNTTTFKRTRQKGYDSEWSVMSNNIFIGKIFVDRKTGIRKYKLALNGSPLPTMKFNTLKEAKRACRL